MPNEAFNSKENYKLMRKEMAQMRVTVIYNVVINAKYLAKNLYQGVCVYVVEGSCSLEIDGEARDLNTCD